MSAQSIQIFMVNLTVGGAYTFASSQTKTTQVASQITQLVLVFRPAQPFLTFSQIIQQEDVFITVQDIH
jgi:flagellar basal body-associated protein FliL